MPVESRTLLFAGLLVGILLAAAGLLAAVLGVALFFFAGILFGIFLNGLVRGCSRITLLGYRWSYGIVVTLLLGGSALGSYFLGREIVRQTAELSEEFWEAGQDLTHYLQENRLLPKEMPDAAQIRSLIAQAGRDVFPEIVRGFGMLTWFLTGIIVILFVGLYVAFEPEHYQEGLLALLPPPRRDRARVVLGRLRTALSYWILGRLASMALIGLITGIGLGILGVPLPIPLAFLATLLTLIPNIGPFLNVIPQALLAFRVGTDTVLYVVLFNLGLQFVESYLVTPIVQRNGVQLPPALTIFGQLLLGVVVGVIGVVLAAPVLVAARVLVQDAYRELADEDEGGMVGETGEA